MEKGGGRKEEGAGRRAEGGERKEEGAEGLIQDTATPLR